MIKLVKDVEPFGARTSRLRALRATPIGLPHYGRFLFEPSGTNFTNTEPLLHYPLSVFPYSIISSTPVLFSSPRRETSSSHHPTPVLDEILGDQLRPSIVNLQSQLSPLWVVSRQRLTVRTLLTESFKILDMQLITLSAFGQSSMHTESPMTPYGPLAWNIWSPNSLSRYPAFKLMVCLRSHSWRNSYQRLYILLSHHPLKLLVILILVVVMQAEQYEHGVPTEIPAGPWFRSRRNTGTHFGI